MLTDGVQKRVHRDVWERWSLSLNSCFDKPEKERCASMSGFRTSFSKSSMSGSPYFVDVELIQIEKNRIALCYVFLDH